MPSRTPASSVGSPSWRIVLNCSKICCEAISNLSCMGMNTIDTLVTTPTGNSSQTHTSGGRFQRMASNSLKAWPSECAEPPPSTMVTTPTLRPLPGASPLSDNGLINTESALSCWNWAGRIGSYGLSPERRGCFRTRANHAGRRADARVPCRRWACPPAADGARWQPVMGP